MALEMTRDGGAGRTFRSIFGGAPDDVNDLDDDAVKAAMATTMAHGSGGGGAAADGDDALRFRSRDDDEDDELSWNEDDENDDVDGDGAGLRSRLDDEDDNNNNDVGRKRTTGNVMLSDADVVAAQEVVSGVLGRKVVRSVSANANLKQRSIEDWADDEDDEDGWKDALQARVDELELAPPNNNGDGQASRHKASQLQQHFRLGGGDRGRANEALKSSAGVKVPSVAAIAHQSAAPVTLVPPAATAVTNATSKVSLVRARTSSVDYGGARTVKAVEQKRLTRRTSAIRSETTKPRPSSASSSTTRPLGRTSSGNNVSHLAVGGAQFSRGSSSTTTADPQLRASSQHLSEAETVRRHVLEDVKKMSMERIVADAKRLRFLEDYFQSQHPSVQSGPQSPSNRLRSRPQPPAADSTR